MIIPMIFEKDKKVPGIETILNTFDLDDINIDSEYEYEGKTIPRTTRILERSMHVQALMKWSNWLGRYKHEDYQQYLDRAANIGTHVHQMNEDVTLNREHEGFIPFHIREEVNRSHGAFLRWWDKLNKEHDVKIIFTERSLCCEYFGGTLDLLLLVDGKHVLVDYKTSKEPSVKYALQMASYRYMLRIKHLIEVDEIILLMLNKTTGLYTEVVFDLHDYNVYNYFNQCEQTFMVMVQNYYATLSMEARFKGSYIKRKE